MRSFLSIFSRKAKYSDAEAIISEAGLESETRAGATVLGYSSDSVFLTTYTVQDESNSAPCFIESDRYIIQYDIKVLKDQIKSEDIVDLFDHKTINQIYSNPGRLNELPIQDFHLLIWDKSVGKLLAFRDQIGIWPLYYYMDDNWLIVSTDIILIRAIGAVKLTVSEQWIADALVNLHSASTRTYYKEIHLIEAGQMLLWDLNFLKTASYYNLMEAIVPRHPKPEEAHEIFKLYLVDAIEKRMTGFPSIGSELSGGLDSSAVVSMAYPIAQKSGAEFHTFSNVLPERDRIDSDPRQYESFYGSKVVNHLGIINHHALNGEDLGILTDLKSHLKTMGMPTQQLFTMFSNEVYNKASALEVSQLLSGFGGDECVSYGGTGFFQEMIQARNWEVYLREMKSNYRIQNKDLFRGYSLYMINRYVPFGSDLLFTIKKRQHWKVHKIKGFGYDRDFGQKMKIQSRYFSRKGINHESSIMERQYQRLIHPYVSRRLIGSHQISVKYGFSYAFPLLDRDLLEFHLSLPATYKYYNGVGRVLLREAMKNAVPDNIRLRNDKQRAVVPTIHKRHLKDEETIRNFIRHSQASNKYHYLDYQKLSAWHERLVRKENLKGVYNNPNAFYNSMQILLLQEMERTGEYKTGIYC